jgi:hypothetical protein
MSISYKKINSMIEIEIANTTGLLEEQKKVLMDLCEKIYMIESSIEQGGNQQTISDIKGEINLKAARF